MQDSDAKKVYESISVFRHGDQNLTFDFKNKLQDKQI